jgi:hypothetical protein
VVAGVLEDRGRVVGRALEDARVTDAGRLRRRGGVPQRRLGVRGRKRRALRGPCPDAPGDREEDQLRVAIRQRDRAADGRSRATASVDPAEDGGEAGHGSTLVPPRCTGIRSVPGGGCTFPAPALSIVIVTRDQRRTVG